MTLSLFSPLTIGPITLSNRVAVSPMCQYSAVQGNATQWHLQHLSNLGFSGAGLVMIEATAVTCDGRITPGCLGLFSDENETELQKVVQTAQSFAPNTVFGIQLSHAGRKASCQRPWEGGNYLTVQEGAWAINAPSSIPFHKTAPLPHELTCDEIEEICSAFQYAAQRAIRAGIKVIEIHAAHGYLIHQFLSPLSNIRTDQYGASIENRMRFPLQIVDAIKHILPQDVALGARITGTDWVDGGIDIEQAICFAQQLKKKGIDYVCVTTGGLVSPPNPIPVGPNYQVSFAEAVKKEVQIPTRAVGMIKEPHQANTIILEEKADFVAIGRSFLDNPRWGWYAADVLKKPITIPPQYARARPPYWEK